MTEDHERITLSAQDALSPSTVDEACRRAVARGLALSAAPEVVNLTMSPEAASDMRYYRIASQLANQRGGAVRVGVAQGRDASKDVHVRLSAGGFMDGPTYMRALEQARRQGGEVVVD